MGMGKDSKVFDPEQVLELEQVLEQV